ncbi:MAG: hypothetical protein MPW15_17585 [Candidatus Manganitrophus sp.]|nr:hypothetical protein [Candidatus Manganitrophus sp.]
MDFRKIDFQRISLLPASRRYRRWLDEITLSPSWLEGTAVITIFVEGSIHDRKEIGDNPPAAPPIEEVLRNHFLVRHHQLDPSALDLIRAHYLVEHGHRLDAWQIVLQNATSARLTEEGLRPSPSLFGTLARLSRRGRQRGRDPSLLTALTIK